MKRSPRAPAFRWLGTAGIELRHDDRSLLIDPYLTRVPVRKLWLGRVRSNTGLAGRHIAGADELLVTHSQFDHLLDVPEFLRLCGGQAYESANTCALPATFSSSTRSGPNADSAR